MALETLDAKLKKLNLMGGHIAPKCAELFQHLIKQSQEQAVEGVLIAQDFTRLETKIKHLENKQPLSYEQFRNLLLIFWAGVFLALGMALYG